LEATAAVFAIVLGTVFFLVFGSVVLTSIRTRSWVPAEAVVTNSSVRKEQVDEKTTYHPAVGYSYTFGGSKRFGDTIRLVRLSEKHSGYAEEVISRYPVGGRITVYVDPTSPAKTVIVRGIEWHAVIAVAFGIGCMAFGMFILSRQ
jgi:hypothetical protein